MGVAGQQSLKAQVHQGEGRGLVRFHCSICHDLAIVRQQRLSEGVWDEVLEDMLTFGAVFDDVEDDLDERSRGRIFSLRNETRVMELALDESIPSARELTEEPSPLRMRERRARRLEDKTLDAVIEPFDKFRLPERHLVKLDRGEDCNLPVIIVIDAEQRVPDGDQSQFVLLGKRLIRPDIFVVVRAQRLPLFQRVRLTLGSSVAATSQRSEPKPSDHDRQFR
ncbi:MAG: hypothetical protein IH827_02265 [Myxococcales bacterium]|nr:hypothetical protein [Myxococcales bacterium]